MLPPVPAGWRLRLADGVRVLRAGGTAPGGGVRPDSEVRPGGGVRLVGGAPLRVLTLTPRGAQLLSAWLAGQPVSENVADRRLARRLLDAGLADPDPPAR